MLEIGIAIGLGLWFALMGTISYLCYSKTTEKKEEDKSND